VDFTFTTEQRLMASAFRELAAAICSPRQLRAAVEDHDNTAAVVAANSQARWHRLAEIGIPGVLAPEVQGGMGLTDVDFVLVAEEAGHTALPEPLVEHAGVAVPALTELADHPRVAKVLAKAATGRARVAIGHPINPFVLDAARSNYLLLTLDDEIHLVERARAQLVREPSIDPLRELFKVKSPLSESTCIASGRLAQQVSQRVFARGTLYCSAQLVGLCARMIELATAYARERQQFGKPIGAYQAIKHQLATAQVKLEFARPVLYAAATLVGSLDERAEVALSHAKMAATDAADLAARTSLQVHGAMGYSWEVDLHFYMKRAWALAGAWGDRGFHLRRLCSRVLEGGMPLGPGQTFEELPT
jgi:alkylation response protein AidB-like acyl-CoA dehydrogenase